MKKFLKYALVFALALGASAAAHAGPLPPLPPPPHNPPPPPPPHTAPEFDAALAVGGLTLVGGTIAVMRTRRRK